MVLLIIIMIMALLPCTVMASEERDTLFMRRVFSYKESIETATADTSTYIYTRYNIRIPHRNFSLMFIPSMYVVSKGDREYAGESYTRIDIKGGKIVNSQRQVSTSTVPRNKTTMPSLAQYIIPNMYDVSIIETHILSPFNRANTQYYHYRITPLTGDRAEIAFLPRLYNTQLISGTAIAEASTGRLISINLNGEYDMVKLRIRMDMGDSGVASLYPKKVSMTTSFVFIGNRIYSDYYSVYAADKRLPDSIVNNHDRALMDSLRPEPLPATEREIFARHDSARMMRDDSLRASPQKRNPWKTILWDVVGDNLLNRIKSNFGPDDKGYFRLSPILNPLYLDYSHSRGISYKFKVRARYDFTTNSYLSLNFKGGWSFKLSEFYYRVPLRYAFNKKRNGYIEIEVGNGNRTTTSEIADMIKDMKLDSIKWSSMNIDYFKHTYLKFNVNYDINDKWSMQPGVSFHLHRAVDKAKFKELGQKYQYKTFAPKLSIQYRPWGWNGLSLTADYERGIRGVSSSDTDYERMEFDAQWCYPFSTVRSLSMRAGGGFYTSRSNDAYFLDYTNFREESLSDGWDDDWTGEFQLLDREWYNASQYYVRANVTYESPLMILSRLPYVGRFIETERIYVSALFVEHLHPYIEYGYGFTNRVFSIGLFAATKNTEFDGVGARFAFELFDDW